MFKIKPWCFIFVCCFISSFNWAQNITIPDANFKNYLVTNFDTNIDGEISFAEATAVVFSINCSSLNIADLTGIEAFTNIQNLICNINLLTSIPDLSGLSNLQSLNCSSNQLTDLPNISGLTNMQELNCRSNQITSLPNLSTLTSLRIIYSQDNQITSINALPTSLEFIQCFNNKLASLPQLSHLINLTYLDITTNRITNLPTMPINLDTFLCTNNWLDESDCPEIQIIEGMGLTTFTYNPQISGVIDCDATIVFPDANFKSYLVTNFDTSSDGEISFAEATIITNMDCSMQNIVQFDGIEFFTSLQSINCSQNDISSFPNISNLTQLIILDYSNNDMGSIPVLPNSLEQLDFSNNNISLNLDLSSLINLEFLDCSNNFMTIIVSLPTSLIQVEMSNNNLITIPNLSGLTNLNYFDFSINWMSDFPILPTSLEFLNCSNNFFASLPDLTYLVNLDIFQCNNNDLLEDDCPEIRLIETLGLSTFTFNPQNSRSLDCHQSPLPNIGGPYFGDEGSLISLNAASSSDPDGSIISYAWDLDNDGIFDNANGVGSGVFFPDNGLFSIGLQIIDDEGNSSTAATTVQVNNVAPVAHDQTISIDDDSSLSIILSATDVGDDTFNFTIIDHPANGFLSGTAPNLVFIATVLGNDQFTFEVTDDDGAVSNIATVSLTINSLTTKDALRSFHAIWLNSTDALLTWIGGNDDLLDISNFEVSMALTGDPKKATTYELIENTYQTSSIVKGLDQANNYSFQVQVVYSDEKSNKLLGKAITAELAKEINLLENHIRFPHVAQNEQWWTGFVVVNPSAESATIDLKAFDSNGNILVSSSILTTLGPGQKTVGLANAFFESTILDQTAWIDLESSEQLIGFELFGQGFENMSGIMVDGKMLHYGFMPIAEERDDRYVALSLINPSATLESTITFAGFSEMGNLIRTFTIDLPVQEKAVDTVKGLFDEHWSSDIQSITWQATNPLVGFEIWGDLENWEYQHGLSMRTAGAVKNILPLIEPGSMIVLQNTANTKNRLILESYSDDGELFSSHTIELESHQLQFLDSNTLISDMFTGFIIIKSSGTLNALVELNRIRDDGILAESIPAQSIAGFDFLFPHIASNNQWTTEIMVINTSERSETITIRPYDINGNEISGQSSTLPIASNGRLYSKVKDLFNQIDDIAYIRILASAKTFIGHLIYYTNEGFGHVMGGTVVTPLD